MAKLLEDTQKFQPAIKKGITIETEFTYYFTWTIRN